MYQACVCVFVVPVAFARCVCACVSSVSLHRVASSTIRPARFPPGPTSVWHSTHTHRDTETLYRNNIPFNIYMLCRRALYLILIYYYITFDIIVQILRFFIPKEGNFSHLRSALCDRAFLSFLLHASVVLKHLLFADKRSSQNGH